jgi:hypothetical protein
VTAAAVVPNSGKPEFGWGREQSEVAPRGEWNSLEHALATSQNSRDFASVSSPSRPPENGSGANQIIQLLRVSSFEWLVQIDAECRLALHFFRSCGPGTDAIGLHGRHPG